MKIMNLIATKNSKGHWPGLNKLTRLRMSLLSVSLLLACQIATAQKKENGSVDAEHQMIQVQEKGAGIVHTLHPDAQWYPDAGLGLFIHWGLSSVRNIDASWPMIPGWGLMDKKLDSAQIAMVVREKHYNIYNDRPLLTPNEYWSSAKVFNPQHYDPEKWIKAAKEAGFTYVVLTTRHHEGFAMWPSNFGDFNTKNYMGGKDLVKAFIAACRKYGMKVGLYYSPPDWYFDRDYKNFLLGSAAKNNPGLPALDADLNPITRQHTAQEIAQHKAAYAAMIRDQILELISNYGKIDLLWFDGTAAVDHPESVVTQAEIRKLQPGIVINPRMHGTGDFKTYERTPPTHDPGGIWAEFCNTWTNSWSNSSTVPFRSDAFILGQFVSMRAWGVNYLPSVGPTADGNFPDAVYQHMKVVADWMKINGPSVKNTKRLPANESASVPATSSGDTRYLFAIPEFMKGGMYEQDKLPAKDTVLTLGGVAKPLFVKLMGTSQTLNFDYKNQQLSVYLPAGSRSSLVDVIEVKLPAADGKIK